ncbi:hypothetical protein PMSD_23395 [Paenibacillus macquariensis subsp. defensor]|nr:hypothetical protein PMSD_23395 [Paenibacillus macquariensis subsp. defensor]
MPRWIIIKGASHLYYRLFINWLEIAEEGAKQAIVPKGKDFRKLIHKGMQFAFQFSEESNGHFEIRYMNIKSKPINLEFKDQCRLVKNENKYMRSNMPLAVSILTNEDNKDLQVYIKEYVGKLTTW